MNDINSLATLLYAFFLTIHDLFLVVDQWKLPGGKNLNSIKYNYYFIIFFSMPTIIIDWESFSHSTR